MGEKTKLGLIGLGGIGQIHLRNCLKLKNAKLVAVSDISKKALVSAKKLGVRATFTDYHQLLKEPSIDGVILALPNYLHAVCAKDAAEEGKHVLVEKPLARNPDEGREILAEIKRRGVKLLVGYDMIFEPSFQRLKHDLENGLIGDVQTAYGVNIGSGPIAHRLEDGRPSPVPSWWFQKELTGGGALLDLGSHLINLFRWYFGRVCYVKSCLGYRFNMEFEDSAICLLKFESGTIGIINVGWFSKQTEAKVELFGTVKHATGTPPLQSQLSTAVQMLLKGSSDYYRAYLREVEYFAQAITRDFEPFPSGVDALEDLTVIHSAYENRINL
jgi:predicted dehydrogenase